MHSGHSHSVIEVSSEYIALALKITKTNLTFVLAEKKANPKEPSADELHDASSVYEELKSRKDRPGLNKKRRNGQSTVSGGIKKGVIQDSGKNEVVMERFETKGRSIRNARPPLRGGQQ